MSITRRLESQAGELFRSNSAGILETRQVPRRSWVMTGLLILGGLLLPGCVGPTLTIAPDQLGNIVQDAPVSVELTADATVYTWSVQSGDLPAGLELDPRTGLLAGRPTTPGTYDFTIGAETRGLPTRFGSWFYTVTVLPELVVVFNPPDGRAGDAYDYTPTISGGVPPYAVTIVGLPGGLDYDRFTGRIFGSPLLASAGLRLDMTVKDNGSPQQSVTTSAVIVIKPTGVAITTLPLLPPATIGLSFQT